MATPEQEATQEVRLAASSLGFRLFRNNNGACVDETGRLIRYGLGNESVRINKEFKFGDYIGIYPITVTPEMVGRTVGVFVNAEIKPSGTLEKTLKKAEKPKSREWAQQKANNLVNQFGGIGGFVTCREDVERLISEFYNRFRT